MSVVDDYISDIEDVARRADVEALDAMIREEAPDLEPHMRSGMLAYGTYRYRYASGREGDAGVVSLASQKRYISLYTSCTVEGGYLAEQMAPRLKGADVGRSCVRFKKLADVDEAVLRELVRETAQRYAADPDFAITK